MKQNKLIDAGPLYEIERMSKLDPAWTDTFRRSITIAHNAALLALVQEHNIRTAREVILADRAARAAAPPANPTPKPKRRNPHGKWGVVYKNSVPGSFSRSVIDVIKGRYVSLTAFGKDAGMTGTTTMKAVTGCWETSPTTVTHLALAAWPLYHIVYPDVRQDAFINNFRNIRKNWLEHNGAQPKLPF